MRLQMKRTLPALAAATMIGASALAASAPALAEGSDQGSTMEAKLTQLNDSGASGMAWVKVDGNKVTVKVTTHGMLAGAPHAQHIHIGGSGTCPDAGMKGTGQDGHLQTTDAAGSYGMVAASLTTMGDTSPDSALAVDRFPTGDATYERTFTVDHKLAQQLKDGKGVVVVHGVDYNHDGKYDGDHKSDLDPSLPSEATDPAACGALSGSQMGSMPDGGVETGVGSTDGIEHAGLIGGGALASAGAVGGLVALRRRRASAQK